MTAPTNEDIIAQIDLAFPLYPADPQSIYVPVDDIFTEDIAFEVQEEWTALGRLFHMFTGDGVSWDQLTPNDSRATPIHGILSCPETAYYLPAILKFRLQQSDDHLADTWPTYQFADSIASLKTLTLRDLAPTAALLDRFTNDQREAIAAFLEWCSTQDDPLGNPYTEAKHVTQNRSWRDYLRQLACEHARALDAASQPARTQTRPLSLLEVITQIQWAFPEHSLPPPSALFAQIENHTFAQSADCIHTGSYRGDDGKTVTLSTVTLDENASFTATIPTILVAAFERPSIAYYVCRLFTEYHCADANTRCERITRLSQLSDKQLDCIAICFQSWLQSPPTDDEDLALVDQTDVSEALKILQLRLWRYLETP